MEHSIKLGSRLVVRKGGWKFSYCPALWSTVYIAMVLLLILPPDMEKQFHDLHAEKHPVLEKKRVLASVDLWISIRNRQRCVNPLSINPTDSTASTFCQTDAKSWDNPPPSHPDTVRQHGGVATGSRSLTLLETSLASFCTVLASARFPN